MGIPAYFSFIVKNHSNIIKKIDNINNINNLLLDCNSIIYESIQNIEFVETNDYEEKVITYVCNKINEYINNVNPSTFIYIAFDGVAPIAKLEQQRSRRYKSWFTSTILKNASQWDRCAITPGTNFMKKLADKIVIHFKNNPKCKISTSLEPGEGEHKLFEHIRLNPIMYDNKTTVVYGLDADLIMLCINHLHICKNIYLFRETPVFIKHINKSLNPNELYIMDIKSLSHNISYSLNNDKICTSEQENNKLFDYIFICFMLGNDFMPHFPHINIRTNGINVLMDSYKKVIGDCNLNLTNGKEIYWNNFRKFISHLAENECVLFQNEYENRLSFEKRSHHNNSNEDKLNNIPIIDLTEEKFINPYQKYWQFKYYKILFDLDGKKEERKKICKNYLEALEWNFKYYTNSCPDWSWKYNYNYPPLLSDLLEYVPSFSIEYVPFKKPKIISPYTQLAYVLPKNSLNLLPKKIFNNISDYSSWYSDECEFKWNYCRYFWESHVIMPEIPIETLEKCTI